MAEVFERRGPLVCIRIEWPSGSETWVPWATYWPHRFYVRVGGRYLTWAEFEFVMGMA
jgi:hypothetical protein